MDETLVAGGGTSPANGENHSSGKRAIYKREPAKRIFVNRNLRIEKIQFFGFDMDYTLAVYKSPQMESMSFRLIVDRMISIGYPEEFASFEYNPIFPVRGLWFDYVYGNLLKVDGFGNILVAVHGFYFLTPAEIEELYPNKFLHLSDKRIYVLNTLFNLPETYLVACVINYFDKDPAYQKTSDKTGVKSGEVVMSYKSIFQDIRSAVDWVHFDSDMKKIILENLETYVEKDPGVMKYLLGPDWTSYFDIAVVDARKPLWFAEGTVFREVNTETGALKIGIHTGPLRKGAVYSGGSCDAFRRLVKARGKDVLYIGDHIFGDVLRSKKTRGWRTFLVVPELERELIVWTDRRPLFEKLKELDSLMADIYRNLDGTTRDKPKINDILDSIRVILSYTSLDQ
ncbi:5' nucleotidase family domain-containing protein [Ditylenchus destructor]|nr:5' nucleotidase family domain-containing protein [Ditylenchus destructor]